MEEDDDIWQEGIELSCQETFADTFRRHNSSAFASASGGATRFSGDEQPYLLGFFIAHVVGLQYYSGKIRHREIVGLVRDPLNPYDPNAIKVLNSRAEQVGHIDRHNAAVVSPLIDSGTLFAVEAIVPKPPGKGNNRYRVPCQLHLFACPTNASSVLDTVAASGIHVISDEDPEFQLSESAVVQERKGSKWDDSRRIDEVFALVGTSDMDIAPLLPPKDIVLSELFPHQKEGLGWLVIKENSQDLPPFWEKREDGFVNVLTNHETNQRPNPLCGGIFADDMGLGKTLTLLSLIAINSPVGSFPGNFTGTDALAPKSRKRKSMAGRMENKDSVPKKTLVVCPKSVLSSWISQLEEHIVPGSLKVYLYFEDRVKKVEELMAYDIVLTTYNILAKELGSPDSPILEIEWHRVILDEAHVIKNSTTKQAKAVIGLKAQKRWAVTGTPIQNTSLDLFSIMAFLKFQPFSIKSYWQNLVQRPLDQGSTNGLLRLQALMGSISLRRTKDAHSNVKGSVELPPKIVETRYVELNVAERELYDNLEEEARRTVEEYIESGTVIRNYSTVLHIILRLRQICNSVALCPPEIRSLLPSNTLEDLSKNPELRAKYLSLIEDGEDFDCPVCLSQPEIAVITQCAHIFCQSCILKALKHHLHARCPICRCPLTKSELFVAPPPKPNYDEDPKGSAAATAAAASGLNLSSKASALLELLLASKSESPHANSVVFSQFRKMLVLLEGPLEASGFRVLRLDGSMSEKKRTEAIRQLGETSPSTSASPTVLLASLKAAGAGLNLAAASRVYLVDPWWNPGAEEQAMDRVHRIGQREEVRVVRLIVRGSIEERVLEMQRKKKHLASNAFGMKKKDSKEQTSARIEEIRSMMGI